MAVVLLGICMALPALAAAPSHHYGRGRRHDNSRFADYKITIPVIVRNANQYFDPNEYPELDDEPEEPEEPGGRRRRRGHGGYGGGGPV